VRERARPRAQQRSKQHNSAFCTRSSSQHCGRGRPHSQRSTFPRVECDRGRLLASWQRI